MPAIIDQFIHLPQVQALFWAVVLDLLLGIAAAVKLGVFSFAKVANFMREKVVPYFLAYLSLWIVITFGTTDFLSTLLGQNTGPDAAHALAALFILPPMVSLLDDIRRHLVDLGIPLPGGGSTLLSRATLIVPPQTTMALNTATAVQTSEVYTPGPQPLPDVDPNSLPTTDDPPDR